MNPNVSSASMTASRSDRHHDAAPSSDPAGMRIVPDDRVDSRCPPGGPVRGRIGHAHLVNLGVERVTVNIS